MECTRSSLYWASILSLILTASLVPAQEASQPIAVGFSAQLDLAVNKVTGGNPNLVSDSQLLRRLYLCLIGLPPTLAETNQYLADTASDRYGRAVDQLLGRAEFVEHWTEKLDVMLMERRANTHVPQDQWTEWLRTQLANDRPLHQWMADLLVADGAPGNRAAARFLLDRTGDPHAITKDVSRIYFGRDIQCAQCHNHPSIDTYLQTDYQGLLGYFSGLQLAEVADGDKKVQMLAEKSPADAPFESVFHKGNKHRVLPHLFTAAEVAEPWTIPGEDYHPAEAGRPAKPLHSRREQLANQIRSGALEPFNRNLANRIWALVFGRGVVEPVDLFHAENPPLSEELLSEVTQQLVAQQFDLRKFVRELVKSQTFQRGGAVVDPNQSESAAWMASVLPRSTSGNLTEIVEHYQRLSTELSQARSVAQHQYDAAVEAELPLRTERVNSLAAVDTARAALTQAVEAQKKAAAEKAAADQALATAADKVSKLQVAAESSAAALAAVGQETELTAAVELLKARLAAGQAALEPLQKVVAEKTVALDATIANATTGRQALVASQSAASEVNSRYQIADQLTRQKRQLLDLAYARSADNELQLQNYQLIAQADKDNASLKQLSQELQEIQLRREQTQLAVVALTSQLEQQQAKLPELATLAQTMGGQLDSKQKQLEAVQESIKRLSQAKLSLADAAPLLASTEKANAALAEIDAALTAVEPTKQTAEKEVADAIVMRDAKQNQLKEQELVLAQIQQQLEQTQLELRQQTEAQSRASNQIQAAREQLLRAQKSLATLAVQRFGSAALRPLTPEQIGWSFLAVNNVYKNYVDKHLAEIEKATPATPEQMQDPAFLRARQQAAVRKARAELQGNINLFNTLYGAGPGQPQSDFFATPDQALYASNGGGVFSWAAASTDNVTAKVIAAVTPAEAATALYRGVVCRDPAVAEISAVEQYLAQQPDQRARLAQELVWSLMASAEFRFVQ
jgi:Protein of unknown function (DUF1549)/Protein of unknown function (DUF1553)